MRTSQPTRSDSTRTPTPASISVSASELWAAVDQAREESKLGIDPRPPKSITTMEYAERYGLSRASSAAQLKRLVKQGKLVEGSCRVGRWIHRVYWIPETRTKKSK